MEGIFVPISLFAMIFGIVYLGVRKKERMALMERGLDASIFRQNKNENWSLKWGLVLIMLGLGLILANILVKTGVMDDEPAYFSMLFLFGGAALVTYYILAKRQINDDKDTSEE